MMMMMQRIGRRQSILYVPHLSAPHVILPTSVVPVAVINTSHYKCLTIREQSFHYSIEMKATEQKNTTKKSLIYTKTGDKGTSSLYDGSRKNKDDEVFEALGSVDELNASLGLAHEYAQHISFEQVNLVKQIELIQSLLLDIGSAIATPLDSNNQKKLKRVQFSESHVDTIEQWIDELDEKLPPLKNFILPSGGLCSSQLHVARTICRRSERRVVPLVREEKVDAVVQRFLNRLSDYLFVAARIASMYDGKKETIYQKQ